jgi:NAD(P)-dependent dehydrogenase (short-subunit alcohol dehydrogenase family)
MYLRKLRLDGRVAVITGAAQGIGFATAEALAEAGASVVLTDMNGEAAERAAARVAGSTAMALDVTDARAVDRAAADIAARMGRVDILVANAGIAKSFVPAEVMDDDTWTSVLDVNLNGAFWCARAFGRIMLAQGRGAIVAVGSMSGDIVNRPQEQVQYNASKAAVHHMVRSLAAEWAARGVRVNAVAPTYILTELTQPFLDARPDLNAAWTGHTPMGRLGRPDEIASVIHFLASDAASLMTGSIVTADGGYTCW